MGADDVAAAIETRGGGDIEIIRNGSRGMLYLEPLVEVVTSEGRIAYGPVTTDDIESLFEAGGDHALCHGLTEAIPYFAKQDRLTFARVGLIDPLSLSDYEANGGLTGLKKALEMSPSKIVDIVSESGLRGRGGAGFPAGIKWKTALAQPDGQKYICANADEGDSGTFADRMLMEGDPFALIEGMIIGARAIGSDTGYVYIRSEYPHAIKTMRRAIHILENAGWLGDDIQGSGTNFNLIIRVGAGAYICGEESSMLESIEGKRGQVKVKPPIPAIGLVELAFGVSIDTLVNEYGAGTYTGKPIKAVQIGGPLGGYLPPKSFDTTMGYESLAAAGGMIGHGGLVVYNETASMMSMARYAMEFCEIESCGKCTPCRVGSVRGKETLDKIAAGEDVAANLNVIEDLCDLMEGASLCAMGGLTPMPVRTAMQHFPDEFIGPDVKVAAE